MSVHFISGKPGGGKSLYGVKLIIEELLYGHRTIITNVPLKIPELHAYLQEHSSKVIDVITRVWVLTDEQTQYFWTFRPNGVQIPRLHQAEWSLGQKPSYGAVTDNGVMYVIDEVHNFFGSRQWAETGRDVLFYLSQHRKLGDTVVCITQAIQNVDKQFRSVTQDFTFIRNLSKERLGLFRLPSLFVRRTYNSPPSDTSTPMESGTFTLNVAGVAACYDSAVGVGIHGRVADKTERKKGLPWYAFVGATVVIIASAFLFLPSAMARLFSADPPKVASPVTHAPAPAPAPAPVSNVGPGVGVQPAPAPSSDRITMTGFVQLPSGYCVATLSDGRVIRSDSPRVKLMTPAGCIVDGVLCLAR